MLHIISINHNHRQPVPRVCTRSASTSSKRKREMRIIECIFHQKLYHRAHISPYHLLRTSPSLLQAHPTPSLQGQTAPYLNVHLPPSFQSPLGSLSQSQNHDCGITIYLTFILLPYNLSLMDHQGQYQAHNKAIELIHSDMCGPFSMPTSAGYC